MRDLCAKSGAKTVWVTIRMARAVITTLTTRSTWMRVVAQKKGTSNITTCGIARIF